MNEGGGVDYDGGGTWVRALKDTPCIGVLETRAGHAVAFAGPLRHGGYAVTSGVRMILVLFLYIEGWPYGHLLQQHKLKDGGGNDPGDAPAPPSDFAPSPDAGRSDPSRGFVVYRETAALMEALDTGNTVSDL